MFHLFFKHLAPKVTILLAAFATSIKNIEFLNVTFQNAGFFLAAEPRTTEGNLARTNEYSSIWISEP